MAKRTHIERKKEREAGSFFFFRVLDRSGLLALSFFFPFFFFCCFFFSFLGFWLLPFQNVISTTGKRETVGRVCERAPDSAARKFKKPKEWNEWKSPKRATKKREPRQDKKEWKKKKFVSFFFFHFEEWWCKKKAPPRSYRSWPQSRTHIKQRTDVRTCGPGDPGTFWKERGGGKSDTHSLIYWLVMHVRAEGISLSFSRQQRQRTSGFFFSFFFSFLLVALFFSNYLSLFLFAVVHTASLLAFVDSPATCLDNLAFPSRPPPSLILLLLFFLSFGFFFLEGFFSRFPSFSFDYRHYYIVQPPAPSLFQCFIFLSFLFQLLLMLVHFILSTSIGRLNFPF